MSDTPVILPADTPMKGDVLPDSRLKYIHTPKGMMQGPGGTWVPYFCANCGKESGWCP